MTIVVTSKAKKPDAHALVGKYVFVQAEQPWKAPADPHRVVSAGHKTITVVPLEGPMHSCTSQWDIEDVFCYCDSREEVDQLMAHSNRFANAIKKMLGGPQLDGEQAPALA